VQQPKQYKDVAVSSAQHDYGISPQAFTTPEWPPSILAAAENAYVGHELKNDDTTWISSYDVYTASQAAAANAPFSFHHRLLQLAIPQPHHEPYISFDERIADSSLFLRQDSAIGSFEDPFALAEAEDVTHTQFDVTRYDPDLWK
jgi:hypothetical protein